MKTRLLIILFSTALLSAMAQSSKSKKINLDATAEQFAIASFDEFYQLHSLPNDAHFPADIEKNVQWCEGAFAKRGFTTQRLTTETVPLLLAERKVANAQKTILIYLQIDGQPVEASQWNQESPWKPTLKEKGANGEWSMQPYEKLKTEKINRDWRIFVRSASDAKGPAMAFLASLDALKSLNKEPNYNMKVIMDFEEELGSPR
ncbi:MAG: acetylornithine deacetylase, partial [Cyclobacteriaceae bacterium]